ncbi:hypothetical protein I9W82_002284 [Candida metapsilosis]|uniref:Uncharacterized protein n=1 Tax=Candida metapsilosis TaxID=273372 RepID=A0A8H7ZEL2_9ASCO|nr:hypothetical protein I9W82_002284 [Candida metapsilosis]
MVDSRLISKHYELREKIQNLVHEDQERKNLIKSSVLRLCILKQGDGARTKKSTKGSPTKHVASSTTKDYEIELNKLKQEYSTKSKLHDAKLQSLKQENERLKAQVRKLNSDSSSSSAGNLQPRKRMLSHRSIFSPEKLSLPSNKSNIIRHSFPTIFDDELMTPIKKTPETKLASDLMKSASAASPTKETRSQDSRLMADDFAIPTATSSPTGSSRLRSPTKYIGDFENDERSSDDQLSRRRSPSPEFTPNRRPRVLRSTDSSVPSAEKSEQSSTRNGNASVEHSGSPIKTERRIKKVRKRRTLGTPSLEKSDRPKMAFPDVDDDNINTLAKYEDAHFEENDGAAETISLKRKLDLNDQILDPEPPKKRRNVFTID